MRRGSLRRGGATVAVCEYCGTKQTLPRLDDDRRANLYDRANHFRRNNDFDKAMGIYEQILNEDTTDAEAYWSLVLCRYGIEYVEDPSTHKRVPTVNRAQFTSIFADEDYKSALRYADAAQRAIYEQEAAAIDEIQRGILAISEKEEPFDVFICYKEDDGSGRRTPDSVLANDLYHQLTQEGFKVFFARITLEDKLGTAYEPYIFAALNSAKVMVVLGTKPEYFNAVWVKNEWSRYLALIKGGAKKTLIPAFRDMDPYDLPDEFSHLQAQDMSRLGFMQDLIRGIKKIIGADAPRPAPRESAPAAAGVNVSKLLERVSLFLEDGDWQSATEYCERALDADPRNATAYLGKLMAQLHVRSRKRLADCAQPFDGNSDYKKIMRFGDEKLRAELNGYVEGIKARNERDRLESAYQRAFSAEASADTESAFKRAADLYDSISDYRDAAKRAQGCRARAEELRLQAIEARRRDEEARRAKAETDRKNAIYDGAEELAQSAAVEEVEKAVEQFRTIIDWRDSRDKISYYEQRVREMKAENERKRILAAKRRRAAIRRAKIAAAAAVACAVLAVALITFIIPSIKYGRANSLLEEGKYAEAVEAFAALNFRDSHEKYSEAFELVKDEYRAQAEQYLANGDNINAAICYTRAGMPARAKEAFDFASVLDARKYTTAGISTSGEIYYLSDYQYDWTVLSEVQGMAKILPGFEDFVGLTSSGEIVPADNTDEDKYRWSGVVDVYSDSDGLFWNDNYYALMSDGTIKTDIGDSDDAITGTSHWKDIVSIYGNYDMLAGIDKDGSVRIVYGSDRPAGETYSVGSWTGVEKICEINYGRLLAVTSDHVLLAAYDQDTDRSALADIPSYTDAVDFAYSDPYLAVLHTDGTVTMDYVGEPISPDDYLAEAFYQQAKATLGKYYQQLENEISSWDGIVALYHYRDNFNNGGYIGIRYDGTARYVSDHFEYRSDGNYSYIQHIDDVKKDVESWEDIVWTDVAVEYLDTADGAWVYAVGLRADGTVASSGDGTYYESVKSEYGDNYYDKERTGGTYKDVSDWKLW